MELTDRAKPVSLDPTFGDVAYGYARARDVQPDPVESSLGDQVQAWIDNGYCTGDPMNDTLLVADSVYFDVLDILYGEDAVTVLGGMTASITENIGIFYRRGARNLLFAYLPPLEASPIVPTPPDPAQPSGSALYSFVFLQPVIQCYSNEPFSMNGSVIDFFASVTGALARQKHNEEPYSSGPDVSDVQGMSTAW